jgi:hypothetical protein
MIFVNTSTTLGDAERFVGVPFVGDAVTFVGDAVTFDFPKRWMLKAPTRTGGSTT